MKKYLRIIFLVSLLPQFVLAGGSQTYSAPGSYSYTVPAYATLTVQAWGAGGSGSSAAGATAALPGVAGGNSSFNSSLVAGGGAGGGGATAGVAGVGGSGGITSGGGAGSTNGNAGGAGWPQDLSPTPRASGAGGSSPNGGAGAVGVPAGTLVSNGYAGSAPGGGGSGGVGSQVVVQGSNRVQYSRSAPGGGGGAYTTSIYTSGTLSPGSLVAIVVGSGGVAPASTGTGGTGAPGQVTITWTTPLPATCTISITPNPIAYGSSATLTWSSTNANTSMYINNIGYVGTSGSTAVAPSTSTDYTGTATGSGGTGTCTASGTSPAGTLTVTPPPAPTATIAASSTSIYTGQSTNILATFVAGSGDTLTHDNIDSPPGTGLGATTNPDASKTISFSTSIPGTYTFYARAETGYYTSWATYAQTSITVIAPPSCTPAYTCSGQTIQYTNTSCNVSNITTCVSPAFCSTGVAYCLNNAPTFNPSGSHSGHLEAHPTLLSKGNSSTLFWNISNVSSCTVTGSDGEQWNSTSSGSNGTSTTPIQQQTIFTLNCLGLDSSTIVETQSVNIVPTYWER